MMTEHENDDNRSVDNRIFRLPSSFINPRSSLASTEHSSEECNSNSTNTQTTNLNEHIENTEFVTTSSVNSFQTYSVSNFSDVSSVEGVYYLNDDKHFSIQDSSFDIKMSVSSTPKFVQDEEMHRIRGLNSKYKTRIFAFMGVNIFILGIVIGVVYGNPRKADGVIRHNVTTETTFMDRNDDTADDLAVRVDKQGK